jgi:prepilin-type N-terminal cleavage/methylation domain-containing protein
MISGKKKTKPGDLAGFTLLEVLLAVAIFLLLAGGIFAAVTVTTRAANEVALARLDSERMDAMQGFLRHLFANLSGDARLELRVRSSGQKGNVVELLIAPTPEFAEFSEHSESAGGLAIGAIPDGAGASSFSLVNYDATASPESRDGQLQRAVWITMLPGVREIRWRFAASETSGFQETWKPENGRPGLADLEMTRADGIVRNWQFRIPAVAAAGGNNGGPA